MDRPLLVRYMLAPIEYEIRHTNTANDLLEATTLQPRRPAPT